MKNTSLDKFTLQKVKTKGNGLEINFEVEETTGVEIYHDKKSVKSDKSPHPDLTGILKVCRGYLAKIYYFGAFGELANSNVFEASEKQIELLKNKEAELTGKITITGISLSGKDDNKGLIITGILKTETGHGVAINSQRLKYNGTTYGFEEDLENLMSDLEAEVFEYVINGKQSQLEMAFDEEVDGKTAAAGKDARELFVVDDEDLSEEELQAAEEALNEE